ncbi:MAG: threonine/serine exporter family protein [Ruminiclostridium sp.]|nr:threonine/serine exporter family protein [Ruminiclostridium sp.]
MKTGELMEIALKAGEILLRSGAEIYRVEDTIRWICSSYNTECESFVLPTGIFISIKDNTGLEPLTAVKRIRQRTVDLHRIDMVNSFSRRLHLNLISYNEAIDELNKIQRQEQYPFLLRLITAGAASFVFTLLFKGSVYEGLASFLIGLIIFYSRELFSKTGLFQFFEFLISGLIAGALAVLSVFLFSELHLFKIIIGSIMIFLPGVAITNSIKDALYGDMVASISRLGEALFTAIAVGAGVGVAVSLGLGWR